MADRPAPNKFVTAMRKVYNPIGFGKGYNFVLWFIFSGVLFGFSLSRLMYLDFDGQFCPRESTPNSAAVGECYTYRSKPKYLVGIKLHLFAIIPSALLACLQFVPVIRHKLILFHRINGYIVITLGLIGTVGVLMIARVSFGGTLATQMICGLLSIMFLGSIGIALYNIKKLQLEQHRAWMLRAWVYAASIITTRFILGLAAIIISKQGANQYYVAQPCDKLAFLYGNETALLLAHPVCEDKSAWAAVPASVQAEDANAVSAQAITFGPALWLALALHAMSVEFYLHLTPAEADRLRNISYQRQLEAGYKDPGRGGLTADRIGDAAVWQPQSPRK